MFSTRALSRIAGILYLIVAVGGGFAEYIRTSVSAANIAANATLFRVAFVTDLLDFACFLGVGLLMYAILRSVNPPIAVGMLVINAVSVAIQALNMLNHIGALLTDDPRLVQLFLDLHRQGYLIAQVYFGLYLLPLGYLVYKSGLFPKVLGAILMVGSGGYVAGVIAAYASLSAPALYFALAGGLAELLFLLWLLIMGARRIEGALA
jgi:uncharacterized protein DUF4386